MRAFVIHGHFYQPFRECPYVGEILIEPSAFPFENWNERIYRECYLPNAYAHYRVEGKTIQIVNNYKYLSFNMGWTLLYWIKNKHPELLKKIMEGSKNAIATSFNHTILPLDPDDDKLIQIKWGIRAYKHFFGKEPQGFWLPELAVDKKTLQLLSDNGIRYTILAPHQVIANNNFVRVPLEKSYIDVFVYDSHLSHQIAFERALEEAKRLLDTLYKKEGLTVIALDGETFGHHKKFGEMGLAYMFLHSSHFTTLEEYYTLHKPEHKGTIVENTSWSCAHGIMRWQDDCGCSTGGEPGWHQKWRKPLREGLEYVRSQLKEKVYNQLGKYLTDPYQAALDFVDVILGKDKEEFIKEHAKKDLSYEEKVEIFRYLNAIKYMQLAFSSDGWFFAEVSGLETIKNLLFVKRAIDLAEIEYAETRLLEYLQEAPSNIPQVGNGKTVWVKYVIPQAHEPYSIAKGIYLISSLDSIERSGKLGKWEYSFNKDSIKLKDTETLEEFIFQASFDKNTKDIPSIFAKRVQEGYLRRYMDERVALFENYKSVYKDMLKNLKNIPSIFGNYIRLEYANYLRFKLYKTIEKCKDVQEIKSIVEEAKDLNIELIDEYIADALSYYVMEKIKKSTEKEIFSIIEYIQELNVQAKDYKNVVNLWEVQNYVWENRNKFADKNIFRLLNLAL